MIQDTQEKVRRIVENYKLVFPEDYAATVEYVREVRKTLRNEYADMTKITDYVERRVGEFPEILYDMLVQGLTEQEMVEWKTDKEHKLNNWFFKTYKEFRITKFV